MSLARQQEQVSIADYLAGELTGELRHEYVDGGVSAWQVPV
ncbi:MAG: hypothetical protein R3E95_23045 [Thiolinea sp.]